MTPGAIGRDDWFTERLLDLEHPVLVLEERQGTTFYDWITLIDGFRVWRSSAEAGPETSLEIRIEERDLPFEQMIKRTVAFRLNDWRYEVAQVIGPIFHPREFHLRGYRVEYPIPL
jgi:hypothetical protein